MDSYIVHIHRQDQDASADEVTGHVEDIGTTRQTSFKTISGLESAIRQIIGGNAPLQTELHEFHPAWAEITTRQH